MKNPKYQLNNLKRKRSLNLTLALSFMSIAVFMLCFIMVNKSNHMIRSDSTRYLNEISQQSALKVNQRMESKLNALRSISLNLELFQDNPSDKIGTYLSGAQERYSFVWIGYAGTDNKLLVDGKKPWDVSANPVIQDALKGKAGVSTTLTMDMDGSSGVLYAVPYYVNGVVDGALAGWTSAESLKEVVSAETFSGQGFSHIIDRNGNFIVKSDNSNSMLSDQDNVFNSLSHRSRFLDGASLEGLKEAVKNQQDYHVHVMLDGSVDEDMNYIPLSYGGWYLISVAPEGVYSGMINSFTRFAIGGTIAIFVLFMALILSIVMLDNKKNREIEEIAYVDTVTGGFTAPRFDIELTRMMKSQDFHPYALLSLDIRKFKLINDTFGSVDGNRVLKHVHQTILDHLQPGEYVARISADTFNILLLTASHGEIRKRVGEIAEDINSFNEMLRTPYFMPVVCGVYIVGRPEEEIITIRDRANTARKVNKNSPADSQQLFSCSFYSDMERLQLLKEKELENNMEKALENDEFIVYLQPKVGLHNNHIVGAEALVRWRTADNVLIPPNDFIPFFEKNGFIRKLDLHVFEKVCRLLRSWIDEGRTPIPISVNLSRVHLQVPDFLDDFKEIQKQYRIPPQLLEIELTETMVFENLSLLKEVVDDIHDMGFTCSMDDFGSGYSSLNVLKDVPVDILKLDRVFFDKAGDERGNDVIESVISLAKKLGMVTISEGVETSPQVDFLRKVNCDIVQGYVFSRPVPVKDFESMVFTSKPS